MTEPLHLFLTAAVLATTIFSAFGPNSIALILLAAARIAYGNPWNNIKKAFSNKLFLAYFIFFAVEACGLLYTHNMQTGAASVSKYAALISIGFTLCGGSFADKRQYRQVLTIYNILIFLACALCLVVAVFRFSKTGDTSVFFYHPLTTPIKHNAVFYSVYVFFGVLYLISPDGELLLPALSVNLRKGLRSGLVVFFLLMQVLLASKLLLVITLLAIGVSAIRHYSSFQHKKKMVLVSAIALAGLVAALMLTHNPIKSRYENMAEGSLGMIRARHFTDNTAFNGVQLRVLYWYFADEILNEHHAWLWGVTSGDSQNLLNQKYIDNHMYIGNPADGPNRKNRGFIGYNFHNQYLESLVRSGLLGLISLLAIFAVLIGIANKWDTPEAWFTVGVIAVLFLTQAPLSMQHGVFMFSFFPILLLYSTPKEPGLTLAGNESGALPGNNSGEKG